MVYRMTKIISPSCMQLKIVRIHLPLMICVLVDKHYGIGGILLCGEDPFFLCCLGARLLLV